MIILRTDRLVLRPLQEMDLVAFAAYRSDPNVARYQGWSAPYSLEHARALLEEMRRLEPGTPGHWFQLAVERSSEAGLIGDCVFKVLAQDSRQAQIGFTLAPSFQGQGFATEAVRRLLEFLFADFQIHRVLAVCDTANLPSARLLERVGMRREAHYIENVWFKGAWGDEYLYALLEREWRDLRDAGAPASRM
jgi:RimJ/RimL family protein N-acetyltransferase